MSIQAPGGATQANITERASDGLHSIHLTPTELHAGVANLTGTDIHTVLIVYYDANGAPIDGLGGEF
jgi:hypothetical protein